jgi:[ribosomal protein S5]-alanine N-acetyltransferase
MQDRIETARLVLRRPTRDDLAELHRIHADPATYEHSPEGRHTSMRESRAMLDSWLGHWTEHGYGYWVVEHEGAVVGFGGLFLMRDWQGVGDVLNVYYRFDPSTWGRGYASEMVAAAVELAPPLPLVARVRPANEPSARVALRAGFERRPELDEDDLVVFARGLH